MRAVDKFDKIGLSGVMKILEEKNVSEAGKKFAQMLMDLGQNEKALESIEANVSKDALPVQIVKQLLELLQLQGVAKDKIVFDPLIVRGLDYYTGFVFEVMLQDNKDFGSIAGGGRYDGLVDQFSKESLPAVGGSIGIDRLFDAMKESGKLPQVSTVKAIVLCQDESLLSDYVKLASALRSQGVATEVYYQPVKLDKQFKYAEGKKIEYAVIVGQEEKAKGVAKLKNLKSREEQEVKLEELADNLK
jgi:histidyl-tRNA synthetase